MRIFSGLFRSQAFAIDVSDRSLQLLELSGKLGGLRVRSHSKVTLPEGIVEHAEILDHEKLSDSVRELLRTAKPAPSKNRRVIVGVPEAQVYSMHFNIAKNGWKKDELDEIVLQQAEMMLPFPLEALAWDYEIVESQEEEYLVLFSAIKKEVAEGYASAMLLAGLALVALEPEAAALGRALVRRSDLSDDSAVAILDIGGSGSRIVIFDRSGQQLSVSKPIGGIRLTEYIAHSKKLSFKAAELHKIKHGVKGDVGEALEKVFGPVFREFVEARDYYEGKMKRKVDKVLVSGGMSQMNGLTEYLAAEWKIDCQVAAVNVSISGDGKAGLAVLTGLALRGRDPAPGLSFVVPD